MYVHTQLSIEVFCKQFPSNTNCECNCPLFIPTTCLPFTSTPSHPLRKGLILLKLTWNKHLWDLSRAPDEMHTHRFMQVRYLSRHDSSKSMTPSTLKKAQQRHKQTQTQLFCPKNMDICMGRKRKAGHLQFCKCYSLVISPILCALRSRRHNHSLNMFTVSFSFTIQCPTRILHFQNGTTRAKCL